MSEFDSDMNALEAALESAPKAPPIRSREDARSIAEAWQYIRINQADGQVTVRPGGQEFCEVTDSSYEEAFRRSKDKFTEYLEYYPDNQATPILPAPVSAEEVLAILDDELNPIEED